MSQRFCSTCQSFRKEEGGVMKNTKVKRWMCADCAVKCKLRQQPVIDDFAPKKPEYEWQHWDRKLYKI